MSFENSTPDERYSLLLIDPKSARCLVHRGLHGIELPELGIPPNVRPAADLTATIQKEWNLSSIVIDWIPSEARTRPYAILEVLPFPRNDSAFHLDPIAIDNLTEAGVPEDVLLRVGRLLHGHTPVDQPFARFGWLANAERWLAESLHDMDLHVIDVQQLNASAAFALARMETSTGKAYWLKATGDPNTHEFGTTAYLAEHYPSFLPPIIAMRTDWNAWLMEDFGTSLHSSESLEDFRGAVQSLATLQKLTAGKTEELLAAGFGDHRLTTLDSHIDDLIEFLELAMRQQTSTKVEPLSSARLKELGVLLHNACDAMGDLHIPDCVLHGDISPGSILKGETRYVFTDWCEAYVGNPFITFEQFCVHTDRIVLADEQWRSSLSDAYRSVWASALQHRQMDVAVQLAPLLSVLSYLYGRGDWLHTLRRHEPAVQSHSRSLARRMDQLAFGPRIKEVLCRPR